MSNAIPLRDYQIEALGKLRNGSILCGKVGSGKSRTALAYYYILCGGEVNTPKFIPMKERIPLYIITTARKRDTREWEMEFIPFRIKDAVVDSWNNIKKYRDVTDSMFIFDEQRVVGSGAWVKSFLRIARSNIWILLSATPGDRWTDYIPVFVANGFYRNRTEFNREHCIFSRFTNYPKITGYRNQGLLMKHKNDILVPMRFERDVQRVHEQFITGYDPNKYHDIFKRRWNIWEDAPIVNAAELCQCLRKLVNSDISRANAVLTIMQYHEKAIIFYNYDYELEILRCLAYGPDTVVAEWNGHKHEPIPDCEQWVYLVQYTAGAEGWNCVSCDTIIFFSQNYSYRTMVQAAGRTDRLNSPYDTLYYFHLKSNAPIDKAISMALAKKKDFNERDFAGWEKRKETNVNTDNDKPGLL
ncbi:MAG: DEAD/DEAH box helicase family protein [Lachnospiraceae bacterium]|nr:DEAD/DEAH box helicase family protein [Lachnospiraceae bacterium]